MNRIGRARADGHVAGAEHCQGKVRKSFFGTNSDDRFALGIEFDAEPPQLRQTDEGAVVDGQMLLADVTHTLGLQEVAVKEAHTIAGYIHARLGRIGHIGDTVTLDSQTVKILEMSGRRITRVLITPQPPPEPEAEIPLVAASRAPAVGSDCRNGGS